MRQRACGSEGDILCYPKGHSNARAAQTRAPSPCAHTKMNSGTARVESAAVHALAMETARQLMRAVQWPFARSQPAAEVMQQYLDEEMYVYAGHFGKRSM